MPILFPSKPVAGATCAGDQQLQHAGCVGVRRMFRVIGLIALAYAASSAAVFADTQVSLPDAVLGGTLTGEDNQTYRLVPFTVPEGTTRITVDFDYTTRDARTTIDLGVLGPEGFRGWSGGNKRSFTISASDATPSYLPGF